MSRGVSCLNYTARSLFACSSSIPSRTVTGRHYAPAVLKKRTHTGYLSEPPRATLAANRTWRRDNSEADEASQNINLASTKHEGSDRRKVTYYRSRVPELKLKERVDYSTMREPDPVFAEHLGGLFSGLQFPKELARRILTHASHPAAVYGHNGGLSFLGRRVLHSYLLLLLSSSPHLQVSDDLEEIVSRTLNTYVLGEHVGSKWGLGRVMRWTPTVKAERLGSAGDKTSLMKSVGLYKVQGDTVAAVIGGMYHQFGGSVAHRVFHTRVLPLILLGKKNDGLPAAFHGDARSICNQMGGLQGPLLAEAPASGSGQSPKADAHEAS
ncbi:hypothetical protein E1B28_002796 [Marasmius oreades]|uniref:RNase III domain-containing protein n=1 Tax=Marasmius oreades TaxID=181124 RepID=A0A9P7RNH0_9AGAR|nr:uncharacterized protein E1B28_002796 [Marasmius oreades]KAG7086876.1 hypothetical protein E1B28_002796 [Marasmius oreades]